MYSVGCLLEAILGLGRDKVKEQVLSFEEWHEVVGLVKRLQKVAMSRPGCPRMVEAFQRLLNVYYRDDKTIFE